MVSPKRLLCPYCLLHVRWPPPPPPHQWSRCWRAIPALGVTGEGRASGRCRGSCAGGRAWHGREETTANNSFRPSALHRPCHPHYRRGLCFYSSRCICFCRKLNIVGSNNMNSNWIRAY